MHDLHSLRDLLSPTQAPRTKRIGGSGYAAIAIITNLVQYDQIANIQREQCGKTQLLSAAEHVP